MTDQPISPDLALIDPGLARASRRSLPDPGCFRPGYATPTTATQPARAIAPSPTTPDGRARRKLAIAGRHGRSRRRDHGGRPSSRLH